MPPNRSPQQLSTRLRRSASLTLLTTAAALICLLLTTRLLARPLTWTTHNSEYYDSCLFIDATGQAGIFYHVYTGVIVGQISTDRDAYGALMYLGPISNEHIPRLFISNTSIVFPFPTAIAVLTTWAILLWHAASLFRFLLRALLFLPATITLGQLFTWTLSPNSPSILFDPIPHSFRFHTQAYRLYISLDHPLPYIRSGHWGSIKCVADPNSFYIEFPSYPLPLLILTASAFLTTPQIRRRLKQTSDPTSHPCPHCSYDLRATPTQCPECGTIPTPAPTSPSPS